MAPEIPPERILDRLTRMDELLALNLEATRSLTEAIKSLKVVPAAPPVAPPVFPPDALEVLKQIHKELKSMSFTPRKERIFTYFTYPLTGERKTVPAGTTKIDFYKGVVTLPDGTRETLSDSLEARKEFLVRSVFVETDKAIKVKLDDYGKIPVDAEDFLLMTWINFKTLWIYTTETTNISAEACTNPEAILRKLKMPSTKTVLPITRTTATQDLSTAALSKTTALTTRFKLLSVLIYFDAAVSPTVTITFDSKDGANYDVILKRNTLAAAQNYVFIGGDGYVFEKDDQIKVDITSVAATCYLTILAQEV